MSFMDDISKKEPYLYCGVHQRNGITPADMEAKNFLGTVWQREGKSVFLDVERTTFAHDALGVSHEMALRAHKDVISSTVAVQNHQKKLDDFPVDPSCEVPMAAKSQAADKQVATRRPSAFRPSV